MANNQPDDPVIFVDEEINIYEGAEAAQRLKSKSDSVLDPQKGIVQAGQSRWQEAQRYERRTWLEKGRGDITDRNEHHRERFAGYSLLRGMNFARGIELGCGPFTNMRLILEPCSVADLHLLDPLVEDYLTHPACRYQGRRLLMRPVLSLRHPANLLRTVMSGALWNGKAAQPVTLHRSTIEDFKTELRFDLVVMINVIDHCLDAQAIFQKIKTLLQPGGILVFHEYLYSLDEIKRLSTQIYDAGHPLRVEQSLIVDFLAKNFAPMMHAEYYQQREFRGLHINDHELYFIGRRLAG